MKVSFKWGADRKLAEDGAAAVKKLGADCARQLRARLADLHAAQVVGELVAGQPHPLKGDRKGEFAVKLSGGQRLVFDPEDDPVPMTGQGHIDWPRVTRVRVTFIGDYHD